MADLHDDVAKLKIWREVKVDPMLTALDKAVLSGDGPDQPSLLMFADRINQKMDLIIEIPKNVGKFITWGLAILIALATLWGLFGPTIRHAIGLLSDNSRVPAYSTKSSPPQDAGNSRSYNPQ